MSSPRSFLLLHLLRRLSEPSAAISFLNSLLEQCPDGNLDSSHLMSLLVQTGVGEDLRAQLTEAPVPSDPAQAASLQERADIFDSIRSLLHAVQKALVGREFRYENAEQGSSFFCRFLKRSCVCFFFASCP